jgi:diguanylate cyclase (GGDEF)-like protein
MYLLIICLPAWALGWRAAVLVGLACAGVSIAANGMSMYPLGHLAIAWNLAMRMLAVTIIVVLMRGIRRAFDGECQRARSDALTGLLNRAGLEHAVEDTLRNGKDLTVFYLDLDGFKAVNDNYGHAAGDHLLREAAKRLLALACDGCLVARIGGDEFVVALQRDDPCPGELAGEIVSSIGGTWYDLGSGISSIGVSVGVARTTVHGRNLAALLNAADAALYEAKARGKARFIMATPPLHVVEGGSDLRSDEIAQPHLRIVRTDKRAS